MKHLYLALSLFALPFSSSVNAEEPSSVPQQETSGEEVLTEKTYPDEKTVYVSDQFFVPLRETPCSRCTIVHRGIKSGTRLRQLEVVDGWAHLVTARGKEGWMEAQYLVEEPIARIKVGLQQKELAALKKRNSDLEASFQELRNESKALRDQLDSSLENSETLERELNEIRAISSDAIAMSQQNEQLVINHQMLQRENDALKANVDDLQRDKRNESFLYGGLTVFLGLFWLLLFPSCAAESAFPSGDRDNLTSNIQEP